MKKLSVVVCARNEARCIEPCLKALKNQIVKPEIIVVDGHSTDKTVKISKKYADKIVEDDKQGLGAARNIGWKAATTGIIAYCDADSAPAKDWTKKIVENINGYVAISGPLISPNARRDIRIQLKFWSNFVFGIANRVNQPMVCGANMAFPREILKQHPFRHVVMEDLEIAHRLENVGKVHYMKSLKMVISPRRYETKLLKTIIMNYAQSYIRVKILRKLPKDNGYWQT